MSGFNRSRFVAAVFNGNFAITGKTARPWCVGSPTTFQTIGVSLIRM